MKPLEVGIIVAALAVGLYFWRQFHAQNAPAKTGAQTNNLVRNTSQCAGNPTNATTPVYGPSLNQLGLTCCGAEVL